MRSGGQAEAFPRFEYSADYFAGLSWRIGPGGLFDVPGGMKARARFTWATVSDMACDMSGTSGP